MPLVDRTSPLPAYYQVAVALRRRIRREEWEVGARIPPELALAGEYAVSRVTIRQALAELVKDDLLERRRGSGTYVRHHPRPVVHDLRLTLADSASRLRARGVSDVAEVLEVALVHDVGPEVREALALDEDAVVLTLLRRLIINGTPAALDRSWFDAAAVPGLEDADGLERSLSAVVAERHGLVPVRAEYELEAIRALEEEAELLGASDDVPLLVLTTTTYLADGRPLEHFRMTWLSDRVRFRVRTDVAEPPAAAAGG